MSGLIEAFGSRTGLIMFTKSVFHFRLQPELFLIAGEQEATGTRQLFGILTTIEERLLCFLQVRTLLEK